MPSPDFDFDLFLSHASEDLEWTERLALRLRGEGVRLWFDRWQLEAGDKLGPRIEDGIQRSRRMAVVWTGSYFRPDKQWTQAETWSRQHADVLGRDRLLLPIWREECPIPALLADLLRIDFRQDERFEEAVAELIRAIGLPHITSSRPPEPLPIPPRPPDKSVLIVDTLGALFVPLLIFLGIVLLGMIGLGGLLIQKGHVLPGCTVAIGSVLGAFGLVIYFLTLRARGIPLSSQERALAGNAQQLLSDHACSAAL